MSRAGGRWAGAGPGECPEPCGWSPQRGCPDACKARSVPRGGPLRPRARARDPRARASGYGRGPGLGYGTASGPSDPSRLAPGSLPGGRSAACGPRVRRGRARCACRSRTGAVAPDRRWGGAHDDGDDDGDIGAGARWALLRVFPRAGAAGPVRPVDHRQGVAPPVFRAAGKRSGGLRLSGPDAPSRARAHRTRRLGGTRPSRTTRLCSPVRRRGTAAGGRCGA